MVQGWRFLKFYFSFFLFSEIIFLIFSYSFLFFLFSETLYSLKKGY
jgi:hypothetical protein